MLLSTWFAIGGCSRKYYRTQADHDVAAIYAEKRAEEAYTLPPLDGIDVDPRSRFFDPSPEDCPALPVPEPRLFGYELPELVTGDPRQQPVEPEVDQQPAAEELPLDVPSLELPEPSPQEADVDLISFTLSPPTPVPPTPVSAVSSQVRLAQLIRDDELDSPSDEVDPTPVIASNAEGLRIVPIPREYWAQLPDSCVPRMLEFQSVQKEFRRSFPDPTTHSVAERLSDAPRLTLPMVCELASLNNRAIQSQKESLYRAALALTAQRYEYVLRPTRRGNGTEMAYSHVRLNGLTRNGLVVPSETTVRKTTAMAGQFLAGFANRVVLTFNGPEGFTTNVGTDLIFEFQQTLFQRDVVFEGLTAAERRVIYEARDLIRAQRKLYVDLAGLYYDLLRRYRDVEISSQDYFSNLRAFLQGRAEYLQAGRIPRVQVDQFEQNALGSRSGLVGDCNSLETSLDRLKLLIGLPPEMPLNLDLTELESLTTSDELTVTRQLVMRTRGTLIEAAESRLRDRNAAVNGATVLINRLTESLRVRRKIEGSDQTSEAEQDAEQLRRRLALLEARLQSDQLARVLEQELKAELLPVKRFARTIELIDAKLSQARRAAQLKAAQLKSDNLEQIEAAESRQIESIETHLETLYDDWATVIEDREFGQLPNLLENANRLLQDTTELAKRFVGDLLPEDEAAFDEVIVETVADTVDLVDRVETSEVGGLQDVSVQENEAMLLALYQRLDLMNERGALADDRRQIKLAADDLRAILDVRARQVLTANRFIDNFDVSEDGATTQLSLALDTPLNRRIERNVYRSALIDYQAGRRSLIQEEDSIKFAVREDLRQLRLRRNQYEISVARAALAYERVVSTRLQLQLAVGNVVARDFLEAQQAYTAALTSVAGDHISFIRERIQLFFDTESIRLDENGYWSAGQDDAADLPLLPDFYDANPNPYGRLPARLKYSEEVRQNH